MLWDRVSPESGGSLALGAPGEGDLMQLLSISLKLFIQKSPLY